MADYSAEDFAPSKHCNKHQEMAVRRAFELNSGLMEALDAEGTVENLKRLHRSAIVEYKKLRDLFYMDSPEYRHKEVWDWVVDHWYSGALKRSVRVTMKNMHSENRKAIKERTRDIYG